MCRPNTNIRDMKTSSEILFTSIAIFVSELSNWTDVGKYTYYGWKWHILTLGYL